MQPDRLRNIMIAIFFGSIVLMVAASYLLKDTPRQGGLINSGPNGIGRQAKTEYYPTGEVRAEGAMSGYYKEGKWTYYRKDGSIELIEYYTRGNVDSTIWMD